VGRWFRPDGGYRSRELPSELCWRLQEVLALPRPPATLGEMVDSLAARSRQVPLAELCCRGSRHRVTVGSETFNARCVVDALILAAAKGGLVESQSPLSGRSVVVGLGGDGTTRVSPPTAVFSYGVARAGGAIWEALCPYLLAFASADEYEEWARLTPEALTIALSPEEALALARDLAVRFLGEAQR
jgi:hypothetical protein